MRHRKKTHFESINAFSCSISLSYWTVRLWAGDIHVYNHLEELNRNFKERFNDLDEMNLLEWIVTPADLAILICYIESEFPHFYISFWQCLFLLVLTYMRYMRVRHFEKQRSCAFFTFSSFWLVYDDFTTMLWHVPSGISFPSPCDLLRLHEILQSLPQQRERL